MTVPLAILDRDGTIIDVVRDEETGSVTVAFHPSQLRLLTGAVQGMLALQEAGFTLAMATNQPAPAKGQFSADAVRRTNAALVETLAAQGVRMAAVEVCMHHPDGGQGGDPALVVRCDCRKPKPGMLNVLVARLDADRARTWMIGDAAGDVEAGRAAGVKTALVFATNRCELCPLRTGPTSLAADVGHLGVAGGPAHVGVAGQRGRGGDASVAGALLPDVHGPNLAEVAKGILLHGP